MLTYISKGIELRAFGIGIAAYPGDIEVSIGRYALIALWGDMPATGLFFLNGDQERQWAWPWSVCGGATSGR